jgi:hypothetical protein
MSLTQFLVMAVAALVVTVPVVLLIPRVRTSPTFDLLLWVATLVVGFLAAWVAVVIARDSHIWDTLVIADTPALPSLAGAVGGALALNVPLWLLDRFDSLAAEEATMEEAGDEPSDLPDEAQEDRI